MSETCARQGCDQVGTHRPAFAIGGRVVSEFGIAVCRDHQADTKASDFMVDPLPFDVVARLSGGKDHTDLVLVWQPVAASNFRNLPKRQ